MASPLAVFAFVAFASGAPVADGARHDLHVYLIGAYGGQPDFLCSLKKIQAPVASVRTPICDSHDRLPFSLGEE